LESQKESYKILAKQLKVHGFRPGHIPEAVIKKHIPESEVMQHALKKVIDANYRALLDDKEFNGDEVIIDALSIDIAEMQPNTLQIVYAFEEYPVVTLGDYKKIKIDYLEPEVTPAEIDREIEKYIKKDIMLFPKEADHIAKGDMVNFDFKGLVDNKPFAGGEAKSHELEIGSNTFIPGFEEQMIGLKKGEKKTIEVVFPKDYQVEDLAGKPVKFELVINDIKTIQRPEIDEAYIARFSIPAVKTPTEFREYINKQLLDYKQYNSKQNATRQISE
jgi:trigger factor